VAEATGTIGGGKNAGYWYHVECSRMWRTSMVQVGRRPGDAALTLRGADGKWTDAEGRPKTQLDGCIDIDISVTPFTNTIPIRRLNLKPGENKTIEVVYIELPSLSLRSAWQRYTCLRSSARGAHYRFEAVASGFTAELEVDADRIVLDYPGLARRVDCPSPS
jgi:hypothetical protein